MTLTILEILYIVLIIFSSIIWTLLTIALIKVIKILKRAEELALLYDKTKHIFEIYSQIPNMIKESIKNIFSWKQYFKKH